MTWNNYSPNEWLKREILNNETEIISRLQWLEENYPSTISFEFFYGGIKTRLLFSEAKYCFVFGQFIATIFLLVSFIENQIAGALFALPNETVEKIGATKKRLQRANLIDLLKWAKKLNWFSQEEYLLIDEIRDIRNPIIHSRPVSPIRYPEDREDKKFLDDWWKNRIEIRSIKENITPYELLEKDAKEIFIIAFQVLQRFSP